MGISDIAAKYPQLTYGGIFQTSLSTGQRVVFKKLDIRVGTMSGRPVNERQGRSFSVAKVF